MPAVIGGTDAVEAGEADREDRRAHTIDGAAYERYECDPGPDRDDKGHLVQPTAQTRLGHNRRNRRSTLDVDRQTQGRRAHNLMETDGRGPPPSGDSRPAFAARSNNNVAGSQLCWDTSRDPTVLTTRVSLVTTSWVARPRIGCRADRRGARTRFRRCP